MTKRLVSTVVALGAGLLLSSCDVEQPKPGCVVQDAEDWYARYYLKPGQNLSGECLESVGSLKGEMLGVFKFTDPKNPDSSKLAIRPMGLELISNGDNRSPPVQNAMGSLPQKPDDENMCLMTDIQTASVSAAGVGEQPPLDVRYQFNNVKVYSAPAAPGTQMGGELTYTIGNCSAQYEFRAIWPLVLCDPSAADNSADKCGDGSGLNPDFKVTCDSGAPSEELALHLHEDLEGLGVCVAETAIPSFK